LGRPWVKPVKASDWQCKRPHEKAGPTVALEVATDMPSPAADASIRSSVQLQMMTAKLEQGQAATAPDILADWLSFDVLCEKDKHLAQRVIAVIDAYPEVVA